MKSFNMCVICLLLASIVRAAALPNQTGNTIIFSQLGSFNYTHDMRESENDLNATLSGDVGMIIEDPIYATFYTDSTYNGDDALITYNFAAGANKYISDITIHSRVDIYGGGSITGYYRIDGGTWNQMFSHSGYINQDLENTYTDIEASTFDVYYRIDRYGSSAEETVQLFRSSGEIGSPGSFQFLVTGTIDSPYSGGSGTQADPYQLATKQDLLDLGLKTFDYDKHFILTSDIDLNGEVLPSALIAPGSEEVLNFTGFLDGNGHLIRNLNIDATGNNNSYLGLIGSTSAGAEVMDIGLIDCNITGGTSSDRVGAICGQNNGKITNCFATGSVQGRSFLGGLCGGNYYDGTLLNCYELCEINSMENSQLVGGICGCNSGIISNCYAADLIIKNSEYNSFGGLCGLNSEGTITDSFWDTQTTGQSVGYNVDRGREGTIVNASGLTTAQMQNIDTFINAGWDFIGESVNDTNDIWIMTTENYPRFTYNTDEFMLDVIHEINTDWLESTDLLSDYDQDDFVNFVDYEMILEKGN